MQTLRVDKKKKRLPVVSDLKLILDFLNDGPKKLGNSAYGYLYYEGMLAIRRELCGALSMMLSPTVYVSREWTPERRNEWTKMWEARPGAIPELGRIRLAVLFNRYAKPRCFIVDRTVIREDFRNSVLQAVVRLLETGEIYRIVPCAACDKFFIKSRSRKKACSKTCQKTYEGWRATDWQSRERDTKRQAAEKERQDTRKLISTFS